MDMDKQDVEEVKSQNEEDDEEVQKLGWDQQKFDAMDGF